MEGYCTVDDVRRALREADLPGDATQDRGIVLDAITAQTDWLRSKTDRHWYVDGGIEEDEDDLIPTSIDSREQEEQDIPATPHAGPSQLQLSASKQARYPLRNNDPFTRIRLDKHHADSLTALELQEPTGEFTDWIDHDRYEEGKDYSLYVEPGDTSSPSYVDIRASLIPNLSNYDNAVRVSYEYGLDSLPRTIRRAVAFRAGADLVEGATIQIPENAKVYNVETKADRMERKAEELLEEYL